MLPEVTILHRLNISPKNIWEIGVGLLQCCKTYPFINVGIPVKMFEPVESHYQEIAGAVINIPHVDLNNVALSDYDGQIGFYLMGERSFAEGIMSPEAAASLANNLSLDRLPKVSVPCCKISHFDYGQIDVCFMDVEGCEWKILSQMVSRPRVIRLEIGIDVEHSAKTRSYVTPDFDKIMAWMDDNGYFVFHRDEPDYWFVKR